MTLFCLRWYLLCPNIFFSSLLVSRLAVWAALHPAKHAGLSVAGGSHLDRRSMQRLGLTY